MNHIFQTIWNEVTQSYVAASESSMARGKKTSSKVAPLTLAVRPMAMEQRFMFDGAALSTNTEAVDPTLANTAKAVDIVVTKPIATLATADVSTEKLATDVPHALLTSTATANVHQIVVVDGTVVDYQTLIAGIDPSIPIIILEPDSSGKGEIEMLAQVLSRYQNLDAIHLVTEGRTGAILLGNEALWSGDLEAASPYLKSIGNALKPGGDLMLYGCSVAGDAAGQKFVDDMVKAVGGQVDIAASNDRTGPTALGGDWDLEYHTGSIGTVLPFTLQGMQDISHCLGCTVSATVDQSVFYYDHYETGKAIIGGDGSTILGAKLPWPTYALASLDSRTNPPRVDDPLSQVGYWNTMASFEQYHLTECASSAPANTTPTFTGGSTTMSVAHDSSATSLVPNLHVSDTDSGQTLTWTVSSGPTHGTIAWASGSNATHASGFSDITPTGTITYTPTAGYAGSDSVTFQVSDGTATVTRTLNITVTSPSVTSATYDASTGVLVVTGTGMTSGDTINTSKLTLTGESGGTYTLAGAYSVTASSATTFTVTLDATDKMNVDGLLNKNGTSAVSSTTFNFAAASNWDTTASALADLTGNGITVSNVLAPAITSATYNASTGVLVVTGTNLIKQYGANNDIDVTKLSLAGQGGSYTLTANTSKVEITSATSFTVTLGSTDKTAVNANLDRNGTSSSGTTTYNLAAADDWNGPITGSNIADLTGNAITVSGYNSAPTVTGTPSDVTVTEDLASNFDLSAVTVADADGNSLVVTLTASAGTFAATSSGSVTVGGSSTGTLTLSGTAANINTWLDTVSNIKYTGASNASGNNAATFTLKANDGTVDSSVANGNIDITAVNDAPTNISLSANSVAENTSTASTLTVGALSTTDVDSGDTFTYSIVGGTDQNSFQISGSNLQFKAGVTLDYETQSSYSVTVRTTDSGNATYDKTFTINLTDVNEAPTVAHAIPDQTATATQAFSYTVPANTFADQDTGQTLTYTATQSNGSSLPSWVTFTAGTRTFSGTPSTGDAGTLSIKVIATDNGTGNLSVFDTFDVLVNSGPTVTSVLRAGGASDTVSGTATSVSYTVTFSESVTGVDTSDFVLTTTGTASGNIASITGSGTTYTVTVDTLAGDGTLRLDLKSSDTGIQNGSSVSILSGYTSGATYTLDHTAPSAPSTPDMTAGTDSGSSSTDDVSKNTTPTFTGTAESGSTVTLYDTDGTTVLGTGTATGGTWSITATTMSEGSHSLKAKATDTAGNVSAASGALSIVVDVTAPVVSAVSIPNTTMKVGNTVTVSLTVSDDGGTAYVLDTSSVGGFALSNLQRVDSTHYTAQFTVTNGGTDVAAGSDIPVNIVLSDVAGNTGSAFTTAIAQAGDQLDANKPVVTAVSIPATTMKVGDTVTATITVSDDGGDVYTLGSSSISGFALSNLTRVSSTSYTATFTVVDGGTDVAAAGSIPVSLVLSDTAGNASTAFTTAIAQAGDRIDANLPVITNVTLDANTYKIGDTLTATITVSSDADSYTLTSGSINGRALGSLSRTNATTYTATYTVTAGDNDVFIGNPSVSLILSDSAGNSSATYTTAVAAATTIDANAPTDIALSASSVLIAANGSVGGLTATDTNSGSETFTYTLVSGNGTNDADNASFTIVGSTLKVGATALTVGNKQVYVRVTDAGGNSYDKAFTISAVNGPVFTSAATANFSENATGTVYTALATVSTGGGAVVWDALTGTDAAAFSFDTTTGALTFVAPPDYETKTSYSVTLNAHDGNASSSQALTISITNVNEAPTLATPTAASYTDTSASDTFTANTGTLVGADVDSGTTLTYGITGGTVSGGTSTLAGSYGSLSVNTSTGAFTYTPTDSAINALTANATDTFTVSVSDGTLTTTATYTVNLTAANDTPTLATPTAASYTDTSANDTFTANTGTLVGADRDSGQTLTYGITGGSVTGTTSTLTGNYGSLSVDTSTGAYTYTPSNSAINALTANATDTFTVTVSDGNGGSNTATYTVNLTAANDTPTVTSLATASVSENAPASTVVYTVTGTDGDAGQTLTYSLSGTDASLFNINPSTGEVTLKASANYETKASYNFNVVVSDSGTGNLSSTKSVTLTVTDANDAPTGSLTINGTVKQGETLTAADTLDDEDGIINDKIYQWYADGQPITGANLSTFTLGQDQVGKVITVKATYTDRVGRQEVVTSVGTAAVLNVNDPTTGEVTIGGDSGVGQTLTASNTLADLDGLGTVSYQWQYKDASGQWQNITQTNGQLATGASYTVEPQLALKELRVKASYTDGQGTQEEMYSTANVKAGGLPPTPVVPTPAVTTPAPLPQVVVFEPVKAPTSSFISLGTVNAVPVLAANTSVVIPTPVIPEQSAPQATASVVSLGVSNPVGNATSGLRAVEATRDVVMERGEQASFTLPAGTFVHTDGAARVSLSARLADGRPLPNYVKFNPTTGTFTVEAPQGQASDLQVIVDAVDDKGSSASTTLVIKLKEKARNSSALDLPIKLGKLSLAEQIRLTEKPAGHLAELAALSKAFSANQSQRTHT